MPKTITLRVNEKATLDQLHKTLEEITRHVGCTACGLLGFEVRFVGDPDPGLVKFAGSLKGGGINAVNFE